MKTPILTLLITIVLSTYYMSSMAGEKVVVVPLNTSTQNNRLWGEGRPGADVHHWVNSSSRRLQFALGNALVSWEGAASGCPSQSWVCTADERGNTSYTYADTSYIDCSDSHKTNSIGWGWVC